MITRSPGRIAGVPCFASCLRSNLPLKSTCPRMRGHQILIVDAGICVKVFRCKPRPPTVALMNSEFRLFIMRSQRSVGFALRPRKADSGRVPGDRAARHPRERSARRSPSAPRPARTISSRSPNPRQTHRSQTHKCMHLGLSDDLYADLQRFPLSRSSHFNFSGSQRLCFNEKNFLPRLPACPRCCR